MRLRSVLLTVLFLLAGLGTSHAQSFHYATDCVENVDNASVLLSSTADLAFPEDGSLGMADTLAVRDANGNCVGYSAWDGSALALAAAGPTVVDEATSGYQPGESLSYEVYDVSAGATVDLGSDVAYAACNTVSVPTCRDDGLYADGAVLVITALSGGRLPVEFAEVAAQPEGQRVRLEWTTAQEVNNAGFNVQHRPQDDGAPTAWTTLEFVDGAGTTSAPTSYSVTTDELPVGGHEFRLEQVDQSGTTSLSENVEVELTLDTAYRVTSVAPNPVRSTSSFSLTVRTAQHVTVSMYNVLGQKVATLLDRSLPANEKHTVRVVGDNRASGSYFLRIDGQKFETTERMMIVR
jgi:hypothetical protein